MPKIEKMLLENVIEVDRISAILRREPDLLSMFKLILIVANKRLNEEKACLIAYDDSDDDDDILPDLSDHESDSDVEEI
jgi:hypothetical protein